MSDFDSAGDDQQQSAQEDLVPVIGSKGDRYVLTMIGGAAVSCTCPSYVYRGGPCKHMGRTSAGPARAYGSFARQPTAWERIKQAVGDLLSRLGQRHSSTDSRSESVEGAE